MNMNRNMIQSADLFNKILSIPKKHTDSDQCINSINNDSNGVVQNNVMYVYNPPEQNQYDLIPQYNEYEEAIREYQMSRPSLSQRMAVLGTAIFTWTASCLLALVIIGMIAMVIAAYCGYRGN